MWFYVICFFLLPLSAPVEAWLPDLCHNEHPREPVNRRKILVSTAGLVVAASPWPVNAALQLDVNNALAREYTAFPGYVSLCVFLMSLWKWLPILSQQKLPDYCLRRLPFYTTLSHCQICSSLYPTIATKLVNRVRRQPFTSKKEVYEALDSDLERDRLRQYDSALKIAKVDKELKRFKESQICKYECKDRVSSSYRDEQIKSVQADRR